MDNNQPNNLQIANWESLPESATLLEYLDRVDVIELSKCCKRYRKQFETIIFEELNLTYYLYKNKHITNELEWPSDYQDFAQGIKLDLGAKLNLVRKFKFNDIYCLKVAAKVAKLLPNINTIIFNMSRCSCCSPYSLSFIDSMEHLEHIEYRIKYSMGYFDDCDDILFPKSLKSIIISEFTTFSSCFDDLYLFDGIDSSYMTNLTTLCISTEKMLKNFTPMPTLKEVRILAFSQVKNYYSLEEFFKKNTQLKKIEFARGLYDKIFQIILSYKDLNYLYIDGTCHLLLGNESYVPNYTIKKLFLGLSICGERTIKIINACQNLEILIFESASSEELGTMKWNELIPKIKTLEIRWSSYDWSNIEAIDSSQLFDQVIFYYGEDLLYDEEIKVVTLKNYIFYSLFPHGSYCIMKKVNK